MKAMLGGLLCPVLRETCLRHRVFSEHVTFLPGTTNLILSAPHGGYHCPSEIPDRAVHRWKEAKDGNSVVTTPDLYTEELTLLLREEIRGICGAYPHTVMCRLSRLKVDTNREKEVGTMGNPLSTKVWEDYHWHLGTITQSLKGPALLLDIHGHGHREQRTELGYLISCADMKSGNIDLERSSIRSLNSRSSVPDDILFSGDVSLGALLEAEGFPCVPSPTSPLPTRCRYHHGGYITRLYGSQNGGQTDAIQIESPRDFRQPDKLHNYARALAKATCRFVDLHYAAEKLMQGES